MSTIIRKLKPKEIPAFVDIAFNAYPARVISGSDFRDRQISRMIHTQTQNEHIQYYGLFRDSRLIAGMRLHEYSMNLYGQMIQVGGVGQVAVDLLHKKEKAAKELIEYFIDHFKSEGISLVLLYPFRPDFYKKMGFGYGTKMNQYRIKPENIPSTFNKEGLIWLDRSHGQLIADCSNRLATSTHGMMLQTPYEIEALFNTSNTKAIGYIENEQLKGYIVFSFKSVSAENFFLNDMIIQEFVYETPEALTQLGTFLHTQSDQINRIIWTTQDDMIEHWVRDPRNGTDHIFQSVFHESSNSGIGLMYKIIDIPKFINEMSLAGAIYSADPITLLFKITDSFASPTPVHFTLLVEQASVSVLVLEQEHMEKESIIEMDISDLSSLFMGVIDVEKLHLYEKLKTSNPANLSLLKQCLRNGSKPICTTAF